MLHRPVLPKFVQLFFIRAVLDFLFVYDCLCSCKPVLLPRGRNFVVVLFVQHTSLDYYFLGH